VTQTLGRKLAVLLHADIAGSTSLVRKNETLAHVRIQDTFRRFSETISNHGGIAHEIRGDALVAEFPKGSDAVSASLAFQAANQTLNEQLSDDIQPVLRIGIAMGEVVIADNTVTGEGIVLAQRLEQLAEPGGVVVQGSVSETVPSRLPFEFDSLGEQKLKGFDQPVKVFVVQLKSGEQIPVSKPDVVIPEFGTDDDYGQLPLELPNKPSIAILPFTNMSGDPEQEYFSDGITEDIITELSRFGALFVVARNSSFAFRGDSIDIREVGRNLGVRFVLEGSVRVVGDRVRITGQLIDASTGDHVWADRYDGDMVDIFAVQDEISRSIVSTIVGRIEDFDLDRIRSKPTANLSAYENVLRGQQLMHSYKEDDYAEARQYFEHAISLDPDFASAHAWLAYVEISLWLWHLKPDQLDVSVRIGEAALALDDHECKSHLALGVAHLFRAELDKAQYHLSRAAKLNPNDDLIMIENGRYLMYTNEPLEGAKIVRQAMRQNPYHPNWYWNILGRCLHTAKYFEDAVSAFERIRTPQFWNHSYLAVCYSELGQSDKASAHLKDVLSLKPDFTISEFATGLPYRDEQVLQEFIAGYRRAGFPP
jgi:adenylate cyclase